MCLNGSVDVEDEFGDGWEGGRVRDDGWAEVNFGRGERGEDELVHPQCRCPVHACMVTGKPRPSVLIHDNYIKSQNI
jgi:hypothetical protein